MFCLFVFLCGIKRLLNTFCISFFGCLQRNPTWMTTKNHFSFHLQQMLNRKKNIFLEKKTQLAEPFASMRSHLKRYYSSQKKRYVNKTTINWRRFNVQPVDRLRKSTFSQKAKWTLPQRFTLKILRSSCLFFFSLSRFISYLMLLLFGFSMAIQIAIRYNVIAHINKTPWSRYSGSE